MKLFLCIPLLKNQGGVCSSVNDVISSNAENAFIKRERDREEWELSVNPQGETGSYCKAIML